jgi:hypothetical protein
MTLYQGRLKSNSVIPYETFFTFILNIRIPYAMRNRLEFHEMEFSFMKFADFPGIPGEFLNFHVEKFLYLFYPAATFYRTIHRVQYT